MDKSLNIRDYMYELPPERIALYPPDRRDASKLLVYREGVITHHHFYDIVDQLSSGTTLCFNDTKVIPARLHFTKVTGATIEIFLLHPVKPSVLLPEVMEAHGRCTWQCTVGNLKRWTGDLELSKSAGSITVHARLQDREKGLVEFTWDGGHSFAAIIALFGETPLPPYLQRKAEPSDKARYQTVYAHREGAVAAPTAGLHFTGEILESLRQKNIDTDFLTLHVSGGTFQPVKVEHAASHIMHEEQLMVSRDTVERLLQNRYIVPVGTTAMRTLESLYWYGVRLMEGEQAPFVIRQDDPYRERSDFPARREAIQAVRDHMDATRQTTLTGETSIYIMPGYTFRVCDALITNFHQPGSTLMLLVAAFIGSDWRMVYQSALGNGYRFLSYGDSSLLIPRRSD
ncbi:MAG TPA: S-adenosylmethionine:tRNA ribosyltransferase-isomerase [Ohtaekwangia sp.]|nr:S-adenosylmethionine:tRNA ribosyltransferase-isomerase [Ohtaekwangia sp.]